MTASLLPMVTTKRKRTRSSNPRRGIASFCRGRGHRLPGAPLTDPGVQFSRNGLFTSFAFARTQASMGCSEL